MTALVVTLWVTCCLAWMIAYEALGGTSNGKAWYTARTFAEDTGAVPVTHLAFPLLLAGTVAGLFLKSTRSSSARILSCRRWGHYCAGDRLLRRAPLYLVIPFALQVYTSIARHLAHDPDKDEAIMEVANSFAIGALIAASFLMVPVARFSTILAVLGWSPARAVRLHIWAGRLIVLGVVVHGVLHSYRWVALAGESWWSLVVPPAACWSYNTDDVAPECVNRSTECSCYHHFRNLTGVLATVGLVVIGMTSLHPVRRRFYKLFYNCHMTAAPLVLFFTLLHWHRSVVYLSGGVVYYLASSVPVWFEQRTPGVQILSVRRLRDCLAITFAATDAAMQRYRPGQYVQVRALSSFGSHPWTVNVVPGQANQLRLVIRVGGKFTTELARQLFLAPAPKLQISGFFGAPHRVRDLQRHDAVVIVAGGIGITAYLSLLHECHSSRRVVLHWICRDEDLIQYVKDEYFATLSGHVQVVIHRTCIQAKDSYSDLETGHVESSPTETYIEPDNEGRVPFAPSKFSAGTKQILRANLPLTLSFLTIGWIGLAGLWWCYTHLQSTKSVSSRAWAFLWLVVLGATVGWGLNRLFVESEAGPEWSLVSGDHDDLELQDLAEVEHDDEDPAPDALARPSSVTVEERTGRPSLHQLVNSLEEAKFPAVFLCGPPGLVHGVRQVVKDRCLVRLQRCGQARIALYEEAFEL